jgi:hypothetical protein
MERMGETPGKAGGWTPARYAPAAQSSWVEGVYAAAAMHTPVSRGLALSFFLWSAACGGGGGDAAAAVQEQIDAHWIECSDGWTTAADGKYGDSRHQFEQYKALAFTIEEDQLSEADKLNGIEYRGSVEFAKTSARRYFAQPGFAGEFGNVGQGWTQWRDASPMNLTVGRIKGKWQVEAGWSTLLKDRKPTCDEVPR